jgi:alkylation response protein AidB-like acyl-CoA dehydrogenase
LPGPSSEAGSNRLPGVFICGPRASPSRNAIHVVALLGFGDVDARDRGGLGRIRSGRRTNAVPRARTLVGRAVTRVAEKAMEAAGGSSFYRAAGLERLFRDIQGVRFHRPQERSQLAFSGRLALGLGIDE